MVIKTLRKYSLLLMAFFISLITIGVCSKSSPLYPMNDWVDVNCFFTMGRSMWEGKVLYADLYEQKGPVLYFLYGLVSLISDSSFIGVFLLEVAAFTVFLYYGSKIVELYSGQILYAYLSSAILAVITCTAYSFSHGGSVEQLCLGLMAYGLYTVLKAYKTNTPISFPVGLVNGMFAGMILWIKFTMLGFYVGLCISILIWYLAVHKDWRKLLVLIGAFLLGVAAVSAVVMVYFVYNGAVKDLFTAYFYNNLFLYPNESDTSKLSQLQYCLKWALYFNPGISWLCYAGALWQAARIKKEPMLFVTGALTFLGLMMLTYWGGKGVMDGYGYYDLVLSLFTVFGLAGIAGQLQQTKVKDFLHQNKQILIAPILALSLVLSCGVSLGFGRNVPFMKTKKEELAQYRFAQIINQTDDPTILNYGFLDGGFYFASDVTPNCRFFCNFNVAAPDMWETQWDMLWAGEFDYVITRGYCLPETFDKYVLVDTCQQEFEGYQFIYYLYQIKENV